MNTDERDPSDGAHVQRGRVQATKQVNRRDARTQRTAGLVGAGSPGPAAGRPEDKLRPARGAWDESEG